MNSYKDITSYNNFYEFGTGKTDPSKHAATLKTAPGRGGRRAMRQARHLLSKTS